MEKAGGYLSSGYGALNNLFLGAVPNDAPDISNKLSKGSDFVDAVAQHRTRIGIPILRSFVAPVGLLRMTLNT